MGRRVGLHLSDLHGGAKHGVASSSTKVSGVKLTSVEVDIEKHFFKIIERVSEFAKGDPVDVFVTGDAANGEKHNSTEELHTLDPETQAEIVAEFLSYLRLIDTIDSTALLFGTLAHDYHQFASTKTLGEKLVAHGFKNVEVLPHMSGWYDGVLVDAAHQGPPVNVPSIERYISSKRGIIDYSVRDNKAIPQLVLRGHRHEGLKYVHYYDMLGERRKIVYLAGFAMCGISPYARQVTNQVQRFEIGAWMWEAIDDDVIVDTIEPIKQVFDTRHVVYRGTALPDGRGCLAHVRKGAGNYSKGDGEFG